MKRAAAFQPLSHDHYEGLRLAAALRKALRRGGDVSAWPEAVGAFWSEHLAEHFAEEETLVLPVLREGTPTLAERMEHEHDQIRRLAQAAERGDPGALSAFAGALVAHIRFEEREAFPAAERLLGIGPYAAASSPDSDDADG